MTCANPRNARFLGSTILAAGALSLLPAPAHAQGFDGTPTVVNGTVNIDRSVPGMDTFTIDSLTALINWDPTVQGNGDIVFLPGGNVALFQSGTGGNEFAILNRILPVGSTLPVQINGAVLSQLQTGAGNVTGGTVGFYSPTGLFIGATATFDVGSLMLTSLDPQGTSFADFAAGGQLVLDRAATAPGSGTVDIRAGAAISAPAEGSYVLLAGRDVIMSGDVRVNGLAGYVAAERARIVVDAGGFDISVDRASSLAGDRIRHSGSTGGPASAGAGDPHQITVVASSQGQAVRALFTGNMGFDPATNAGVVNGEIVLVSDDRMDFNNFVSTSPLTASAGGLIDVRTLGGAVEFGDDTLLIGQDVNLVTSGDNIEVTGDLIVRARGTTDANGNTVGGTADMDVVGGAVLVSGDLTLDARAQSNLGTAQGGVADVTISNGGALDIGGNLVLNASDKDGAIGGQTGDRTGGSARLQIVADGTLTVAGTADLLADANSVLADGVTSGTGGQAGIIMNGDGSMTFGDRLTISANGFGDGSANGAGLSGTGGTAFLSFDGGTVDVQGFSLNMSADGFGGSGVVGGVGQGGEVDVAMRGGALSFDAGNFFGRANGFGGTGTTGDGGAGMGGQVQVDLSQTASSISGLRMILDTAGIGGDSNAGGIGGAGTGGTFDSMTGNGGISFFTRVAGASVSVASIEASSDGVGGTGDGGGGAGTGGTARLITGAGLVQVADNIILNADGVGGATAGAAEAGNGRGGDALLLIDAGGTVTTRTLHLGADGRGGDAAAGLGGAGRGGDTTLRVTAAGSTLSVAERNATLESIEIASANGGGGLSGGLSGVGGLAEGGRVVVDVQNGATVTLPTQFSGTRIEARAFGGDSSVAGGVGGAAQGGSVQIFVGDASLDVGSANISAFAGGGAGTDPALAIDGGSAIGGLRRFSIGSGGTFAGSFSGSAAAFGGDASGAGTGGDATGGTDELVIDGGTANITGPSRLNADAFGGDGATGGDAQGGNVDLRLLNGGTLNGVPGADPATDSLDLASVGRGGFGSVNGGNGIGGNIFINIPAGTSASLIGFNADAGGFGGISFGNTTPGASGFGGNGTGGAIIANVSGALMTSANAFWNVDGVGGAPAAGGIGGDGQGGQIRISATQGGTVSFGVGRFDANGAGGTAGVDANGDLIRVGQGGDGTGGTIQMIADGAGSRLDILADPDFDNNSEFGQRGLLAANGGGGLTFDGDGIGGSATGGTVTLIARNGAAIALPAAPSLGSNRILARANGGGSGVEGGRGGDATGGNVTISATDSGTIDAGPLLASLFSIGGSSLDGALDIDGGASVGGERRIEATVGGVFTGQLAGGTAGGSGGDASGAGRGGDATGGLSIVTINGGTMNLTGRNSIVAQNSGGNGNSFGNDFGAIGGDAVGGSALLRIANGGTLTVTPDANGVATMDIAASGFGGIGTVQGGTGRGGIAAFNATAGGPGSTVNVATISVTAEGTGGEVADGSTGTAGNGIGGDAIFQLPNAADAVTVDQLVVSANGSGGGYGFGADPVAGASGGDGRGGTARISLLGGTLSVGTSATVTSNGTGTGFANGVSGGAGFGGIARVEMTGGGFMAPALVINADATGGAGSDEGDASGGEATILMDGPSTLATDTLTMSANTFAGAMATGRAAGGFVNLITGFDDLAGGSPSIDVGVANLTMISSGDAATSTGGVFDVRIESGLAQFDRLNVVASGSVTSSPVSRITTGSEDPASDGRIRINDSALFATTGDLVVSTNDPIAGGADIFNRTADIMLRAGGLLSLDSRAQVAEPITLFAQRLTVDSADIAITNGSFGADFVRLIARANGNQIVLGGAAQGPGYTLTQDEAAFIEADRLVFSAPEAGTDPNRAADVLIRDLTIIGSEGDGPSSVELDAAGIVRIDGFLFYTDAAIDDELTIFAGERIEAVTPGGIAMANGDGGLSGRLFLDAESILVADAAAIDQLRADPDFAGRAGLLGSAAAGSADPLGYVRANSVEVEVESHFFVRNTGTADAPGGITVGSGGLEISGETGGDPLDVIAFGRRDNGDGTFLTGDAFFDTVDFGDFGNGTEPGYTSESTFNGCEIATGNCDTGATPPPTPPPAPTPAPGPTPSPEPPAIDEPVRPEINPAIVADPVASEGVDDSATDGGFGANFPGLLDASGLNENTLIDDPVASGNDGSFADAADGESDEDDDAEGEDDGQ